MIIPSQRLPIVIATRPVDFRRGHDGLAATVQNELGLDPHSGLTVVFRSKRGDRVIVLCRMLFTNKTSAEFRRPLLGEPVFLGEARDVDWPLEPITSAIGRSVGMWWKPVR